VAEPFLSEIRIMSFVFAPKGWAQCNGQLLPINQNQGLFSLLGTTFGGDEAGEFRPARLSRARPHPCGLGPHARRARRRAVAHAVDRRAAGAQPSVERERITCDAWCVHAGSGSLPP
jgi:microcystin-dependent protein